MKRDNITFGLVPSVILAMTVLQTLPVSAQDLQPLRSPRPPSEIISLFDTNGDKRIERSEFRFKNVLAFDSIDTDRDGFLSRAEVPGFPADAFAAADADKDGKLSLYEYSQAQFLQFDAIDADHDNYITAAEIEAHVKSARPR